MTKMLHVVACPFVFILFYGRDWQGGVFKVKKNKCFFSIFISFGLFPQVFAKVNECPLLKLHEMIRMLHAVAFPIAFILFDDRYWQESVHNL